MSPDAKTHLVLIPSYNTGPQVMRVVAEARAVWTPVWVVVDGSTDGTDTMLRTAAATDTGLRVLITPRNRGKGAAIHEGLRAALEAGFTHALTFDADGQHSAADIPRFMAASSRQPDAMILGVPVFGPEAPPLRVKGRRISNWWANLETGGRIADSLFGFRVYPIAPLLAVLAANRWMRRFDFDPEAAVRLCWAGLPVVNLPAPVRYISAEEGGVSHFRYVCDNAWLTWMHIRLMLSALLRHPAVLLRLRPPAPRRAP
ncbi:MULTISPECIES: glycosyltransferase family 2 protein [unclassified Acidisoma]|uniref:glycosyltransferase family 2 protein n=1 Tax=unclassified Acidisoma TaxID=2634065 RepID=UPI00131A74B0|nr:MULTISPECIES: glycosyltransferase family 2 protein [unclassified Acidisoma]